MNAPTTALPLSHEEVALLTAHLRRHLVDIDHELVRTENPKLQHAIAHELRVLEAVMARLEHLEA
jgi:hypothetical protein